jgi:hypothetical protein
LFCYGSQVKLEQFLWNSFDVKSYSPHSGTNTKIKWNMCLCILNIILKYAVGTCLWLFWKLTLNTHILLDYFHETILTLNKFWRWFNADLIVHWVRRVFFPTLSGISCVTILKYTLILSPQFTKNTERVGKKTRRTQCTIRSALNHLQNLFNVKIVSWKLFKFYCHSKTTAITNFKSYIIFWNFSIIENVNKFKGYLIYHLRLITGIYPLCLLSFLNVSKCWTNFTQKSYNRFYNY